MLQIGQLRGVCLPADFDRVEAGAGFAVAGAVPVHPTFAVRDCRVLYVVWRDEERVLGLTVQFERWQVASVGKITISVVELRITALLAVDLQADTIESLHADQFTHIGFRFFLVVLELEDRREFEVSYLVPGRS